MAYTRLNLVNGQVLDAAHIKHMEDGISNVESSTLNRISNVESSMLTKNDRPGIVDEARAGLNQTDVVGALPLTGGTMSGTVNMNGKRLYGLPTPASDNDAATMGIVKRAAPRNLLDNSDFRNPVNQRGQTSFSTWGYTIDRWYLGSGSLTINNNSISINNGYLFQYIEHLDTTKQYTLAWCNNGVIAVQSNPIRTDVGSYPAIVLDCGWMNLDNVQWVALYEGEYTIDTLPEYQPKGYGAELTECRRYYRKYNTRKQGVFFYNNAIMVFGLDKTPMREMPSTINVESITNISGADNLTNEIGWIEKDENGIVFINFTTTREVNSWVYITGIEESADIM